MFTPTTSKPYLPITPESLCPSASTWRHRGAFDWFPYFHYSYGTTFGLGDWTISVTFGWRENPQPCVSSDYRNADIFRASFLASGSWALWWSSEGKVCMCCWGTAVAGIETYGQVIISIFTFLSQLKPVLTFLIWGICPIGSWTAVKTLLKHLPLLNVSKTKTLFGWSWAFECAIAKSIFWSKNNTIFFLYLLLGVKYLEYSTACTSANYILLITVQWHLVAGTVSGEKVNEL